MKRKNLTFALLLLVLATIFSSYAYASNFLTGTSTSSNGFDVSIDRVRVNGKVVAESRTNLIDDADVFSVIVDFTAIKTLENAHVEVILRGRQSSNTVADATSIFDLTSNTSSTVTLNLFLIDSMKSEPEFDLTIKIVDANGRIEQKNYGISTEHKKARGILDVSIDRVRVNDKIVAASKTNFIDESNDFDVLVEFTALEELEDAHVEAVLKDLRSGFVVADSSPNFDLNEDTSSSELLRLELIDKLKQSDSFELTVKIVDAEGNSIQKVYGISMRDGVGTNGNGRALDISIDTVKVEDDFIAENEDNFVIIGENDKQIGLKAALTSLENIKDAHVDAVLTFENGNVVADATATFDIAKDENAVKKLELTLPSKFEQGSFKLKVKVTDAEGDFEEKIYGLKISISDFSSVIGSIAVEPEDGLEAGKHAVVKVNIKNSGLVSLKRLSVAINMPELGVSATKFIDELNTNEQKSEEFTFKIPDNANTGTYTIRLEVLSQFSGTIDTRELHVLVTGLSDQRMQTSTDKLVINVPVVKQDIKNDGTEVVYQLTLTNEGPDANTYTLLLDGLKWANLRMQESNTFVLNPKASETLNIFASTTSDIIGEQIFMVTVQTPDKVLKQVTLRGNVVDVKGAKSIVLVVVAILIAIVFILVVSSLFYIIRKLLQRNNASEEIPDKAEGESYY